MKYNFVEDNKNKSVAIITPTIGNKCLLQAINSVSTQTFNNIHHYVIIDGPEFYDSTLKNINNNYDTSKTSFHITPINTGKDGFYGHRIYAAYPQLLNEDYIAFLDDDNWIESNHIESLVNLIEKENLAWSHSLRNVYINYDTFLAEDCCESIGRWPIFFTQDIEQKDYLVDTSSFCFKRDFINRVSQLWNSGWGGDRRFFKMIKDNPAFQYNTTGLHTLNYILPDMNKAYGGDLNFFNRGNEAVKSFYNGKFPWHK